MDNTIVVLSNNDIDRVLITDMISSIFGDYLRCFGRSLKDKPDMHPRVVLATESSYHKASSFYPDSKILFVSRLTSNQNLDKLIMLPKGTQVLVVNEPRSAAIETIDNIKSMGITHLDFIPYWPGKDPYEENVDIVIYPGFHSYCPQGHKTYIDIGFRDIKLSVLAEIAHEYNIPAETLDNIQRDYSLRYVDAAYKINSYLTESKSSAALMTNILSISENIFIAISQEGLVQHFNMAAEKFFNLSSDYIIGKSYDLLFKDDQELIALCAEDGNTRNYITVINNTRCVIDIKDTAQTSNIKKLISITPANSISKADEKIRSKMKDLGYSAKHRFSDILGESSAMKQSVALAKQYAYTNSSVLIAGESGTGKEMFAQAIHNMSDRSDFAFVGVNCAALPESLAESELFGYEEGAFTGAVKGGKPGKFELAHKGTLFLDEIGDAPLNLQTKLLRAIEEQEIVRVGSSKVVPVDVRIICASNRDLRKMVDEGSFRQDLYYRINVLPIRIPPLREHPEDIRMISEAFFDSFGMNDLPLREYLIRRFAEHDWPGNVRELRSVVQLCCTMHKIAEDSDHEYWDNILNQHLFFSKAKNTSNQIDLRLKVLQKIYEKSQLNKAFGRGALLKDPELIASGLTEYHLKNYIRDFHANGLIHIGSTKQGMRITDRGIEEIKK